MRELFYLFRRPSLLARSLVAMFVVMPILAVVLMRVLELRHSLEIALVALAISPVPPLLPKKQDTAGGEAAYALGLMAVVSLLAIAVVPLSLWVLGHYSARPLQMPPAAIAKIVVMMTLLPLVTGVIVRTIAPAVAVRLEKPTKLIAMVLLGVGLGALLIAALPVIAGLIDFRTILTMAVFRRRRAGRGPPCSADRTPMKRRCWRCPRPAAIPQSRLPQQRSTFQTNPISVPRFCCIYSS